MYVLGDACFSRVGIFFTLPPVSDPPVCDTQYQHALGIGRRNILLHLREHVLLPHVRMASIIRSLIGLAETLRCTLQQIDEETGEVMVDIKNTELYLKVISQIHSVYRTEGSKMLFGGSGSSSGNGNGGDAMKWTDRRTENRRISSLCRLPFVLSL